MNASVPVGCPLPYAASQVGLPEYTLLRAAKAGKLPTLSEHIPGGPRREYRFDLTVVQRWADQHRAEEAAKLAARLAKRAERPRRRSHAKAAQPALPLPAEPLQAPLEVLLDIRDLLGQVVAHLNRVQ
jgi:hypothetical protein